MYVLSPGDSPGEQQQQKVGAGLWEESKTKQYKLQLCFPVVMFVTGLTSGIISALGPAMLAWLWCGRSSAFRCWESKHENSLPIQPEKQRSM